MGIETARVGRQRSILQPRMALLLGCALSGAAALAGCSDDAALPLGGGAAPGTAGSAVGVGGAAGSATAGSASGGSGTSGNSTSAGSGGTALGTAGTNVNGGAATGGAAGSGGSGGSAGSGGSGGSGGSAGNGGSGGTADACPDDVAKTEPGACGCGVPDTDTDSDTAPDCSDACPNNAALKVAGTCGCLPDALGALCLAHRYQFDGTGTVATDSIAGASGNGTVVGATLSGTGTVVLAGGTSDQYIKLPSGLISALGNSATIEAWVTWTGTGGDWQRVFDFGSSSGGQDMQGDGQSYLFLSPRAGGTVLRAAISAAGGGDQEDLVSAAGALPSATLTHLAVVVDGTAKTLTLYQDGASVGTPATIRATTTLSGLKDLNNWLGRSQYQGDEELAGTFHEVRIYSRSLSAVQVGANYTAGADALPP